MKWAGKKWKKLLNYPKQKKKNCKDLSKKMKNSSFLTLAIFVYEKKVQGGAEATFIVSQQFKMLRVQKDHNK